MSNKETSTKGNSGIFQLDNGCWGYRYIIKVDGQKKDTNCTVMKSAVLETKLGKTYIVYVEIKERRLTMPSERLNSPIQRHPIYIPVSEVASFLNMGPDALRASMEQNRCPFGFSKYAPETLSDRRHQRLERSILAGSGHSAPLQSFDGEDLFPTDVEKIARAGFGLASNHAFLDGNKRIGAMMVQLLLRWNGYQLRLEQGELADMFIAIADGTKGEKDLLQWIRAHIA